MYEIEGSSLFTARSLQFINSHMKRSIFVTILLFCATTIMAQQYPFQNPQLSSEERAKDLISRLTVNEKDWKTARFWAFRFGHPMWIC